MDLILTKDIWKLLPFVPKSISPFQILIRTITLTFHHSHITSRPQAENELRLSQSEFDRQVTILASNFLSKKIIFIKVINRKSSRSVSLNWNKAEMIEMEKLNFPTAGWDHQASDGGSFPKPNKPPSPSSSCRRSSGQIYLDADVCGKINVKKYFKNILKKLSRFNTTPKLTWWCRSLTEKWPGEECKTNHW